MKGRDEMKKLSKTARQKIDAAGRCFQKKTQGILEKSTGIERITMRAGDGPKVTMTERKEKKDVTL